MTTFGKLQKLYDSVHLHDPDWPALDAIPDQRGGLAGWDVPESDDPDEHPVPLSFFPGEWQPYVGEHATGVVNTHTGQVVESAHGSNWGGSLPPHDKLAGLVEAGRSIARPVLDSAVRTVERLLAPVEARYGRRGALAVLAAATFLAPHPAVAGTVVPPALAEALARASQYAHLSITVPEVATDVLIREVRDLLRSAFAQLGAGAPPPLDDAAIRRAVEVVRQPNLAFSRSEREERDFYAAFRREKK